ncbi:MAG: hypothetical protein Ta2E_11270 [Mycoplasmoidaceae bacterium]|nr:MAG: hypothetical protein Ta2E_11270 [Mycoplasmoidaceae bacterium]
MQKHHWKRKEYQLKKKFSAPEYAMNEYHTKLDNDKSYTYDERIQIFRSAFDTTSLTDLKIARLINLSFTFNSICICGTKIKTYKVISNNDKPIDNEQTDISTDEMKNLFCGTNVGWNKKGYY